jgi:hypothetical protein
VANQFSTSDEAMVGADTIAGVGGTLNAVPFINVLAPGITAGFAHEREQALRNLMAKNAQAIELPKLNQGEYERIKYEGDFNPEMYATPESAQYQTISEDPRTREYQMAALGRLQQFGDQAADSQESLGRYRAAQEGNAVAQQRENAIRQQMAMRGQGGSGAEFVLAAQGGQMGANRAQEQAMMSAQQAALQRLAGTNAAFGAASGLRGQDADVASRNADIINKFNMYNTNARNAAMMGNTDLKNAAGMRNINTRQGLSGANAGIGNSQRDRNDRTAQAGFGNQMTKFGAINDALTGKANQTARANQDAQEAGKTGFSNFKDVMSMMGGGMG